jgi:hypothetical protein
MQRSWTEIKDALTPVFNRWSSLWRSSVNPALWVHDKLGIDLFDNQIEIVESVVDLNINKLAILQARGAGKTFAVGIGLTKLCLTQRKLRVGIFAPRADQATRIIDEMKKYVLLPGTEIHKRIDWDNTVKSRLVFDNGSEILAMSGAVTTKKEGWHFHVVVIDEAHRLEDTVVSQHINPMLGSFSIAKMIKIGIPAAKNNFWKSCVQDRSYKVLKRSWLECPILLRSGSFFYKGVEYPKHIVDGLSLSVKNMLFPDRPDLHFEGSEYSEFEYKTQFAMEWVSDIYLELDERLQEKLISGTHEILNGGLHTTAEEYYFGLDTAPGTLQPGKKNLDYTALSIWRKRTDNVKEKVACYEWQGDITTQWDEIKQIIHPETGIFHCKFGVADYSNIAQAIVAFFQKEKIPIAGVMFQTQEASSRKNYKNAMFDEFKYELDNDRVKFPTLDTINKDKIFKKSFNEWCNIERHIKTGINHKIEAPSDLHDDHCCADVLAVWGMNKQSTFKDVAARSYRLPSPKITHSNVQSRLMGGNTASENRYLK